VVTPFAKTNGDAAPPSAAARPARKDRAVGGTIPTMKCARPLLLFLALAAVAAHAFAQAPARVVVFEEFGNSG
jgi:hypothetical protein